MNVKLLRKIQRVILKRPTQVNMSTWFSAEHGAEECGTTACIAGWAITLDLAKGKRPTPLAAAKKIAPGNSHWVAGNHAKKVRALANRLLGIKRFMATRLYLAGAWPDEFRERITNGHSCTPEYAKAVSDRIDHFIKTNGKE
jgi:hypothetical protein